MDKEEIIKQIEGNLVKLSEKDFGIYFFTADTKGAPAGSIANIYEHVKNKRTSNKLKPSFANYLTTDL